MEKRKISTIENEISRIGLGTWAIGGWMWGGTEENEAVKTIHKALDKGINLIDTAPAYGDGRSEEIVGRAVREYGGREKIVIATKAGLEFNNGVKRNSSPERIRKEVENSLRRLETEYIDIYQIHWPDPSTPIEKTAETMSGLFEEGKIKAIGVSNFSAEQMDLFRKASPLHTNQPPYNLFEREIESSVLPYCINNNIEVLAYGSICRGLLSGKMKKDSEFKGDDLRNTDPKFQPPRYERYLKAVAQLEEFARTRYNKSVMALSVRWILDMNVSFALWGARKPEQLDGLDELWGWNIDKEGKEEINRIINENIPDPVGPEFMAPPL